jgi:hypothetical protein
VHTAKYAATLKLITSVGVLVLSLTKISKKLLFFVFVIERMEVQPAIYQLFVKALFMDND